tara:strand:- start:1077 stop:2171 length:1095 start_codon:yes stop_codon:yes gene_type:complete
MIVKEVIDYLDEFAPLCYAEEFDNVGLIIGDYTQKVNGILVTLDSTESVIDEAIKSKCNLIISFHPIIFNDIKSITTKTYVDRVIHKTIKNNISIVAMHTSLDNSMKGVNSAICKKLDIKNYKILIPKRETIKKLTTYIPSENVAELKSEIFKIGGGSLGKYENCSFSYKGLGSFKGNEKSNPKIGSKLIYTETQEVCVNITFLKHLEHKVINTLKENHPYEEIAYEITTLDNLNQNIGMGMVGELNSPMDENKFLSFLKKKMKSKLIKHSIKLGEKVSKIAVLGGSGSFAIENAINSGANAFVTSDLKYHDYFKAENKILLVDIGHYESEQYTKDLIFNFLTKKFPNFAIVLSKTNTNPIMYS